MYMGDRIIRYMYRNVSVKADTLKRLIDEIDADDDGRLTLGEVAACFKALWRQAMGKNKVPRKVRKIRTVD